VTEKTFDIFQLAKAYRRTYKLSDLDGLSSINTMLVFATKACHENGVSGKMARPIAEVVVNCWPEDFLPWCDDILGKE